MMRRRALLLAAAGFAAARIAAAQQKAAAARIGLLWLGSPEAGYLKEAFLKGLEEHGLVEGRNFALLDRTGVHGYAALAQAAKELVEARVNVIVTWGATAPRALREATSTIPIVLIGPDPVAAGFARSLSRPGGNVTGVATLSRDLLGKRLELLKESVPNLRRVAALMNPDSVAEAEMLRLAEAEARRLDLRLYAIEVRKPADFEPGFVAASKASVDALFIVPSTMFMTHRQAIASLAVKHRLPAVGTASAYAEAGVLLAYGVNLQYLFRRAAAYTARILKGEKPAEMAIEQASEFDLIINLKTAKVLGLKIPEALRFRASRLID